jgi:MFS family permease
MSSRSIASMSPLRRSLGRTFGSLRYRNFRLLWTGNVATQAGYWMFSIAQGWLVVNIEHDNPALWLGVVGFVGQIPLLLFSLVGGMLADRFDRRKLMLGYQAFSTVFITVFAILVTLNLVQIWHVLIVAFLFGTAMALNIPLRQALVPSLVEKQDLMNAIALNSAAWNAMRVVGPALAGILISTIGTLGVFWIMVVCYAWAMVWVWQMDIPPAVQPAKRQSPLATMVDGVRFVWHDKNIMSLMIAVSIPTMLVLPYVNQVPLYAADILNVGATGLGMMEGAVGLGALITSLVVAGMGGVQHKGLLMIILIVAYSILVGLFGISTFFPLSLIFLALSGIAWSSLNSFNSILIQVASPDEYRGRVFAVYALTFGFQPIGNLAIGALADVRGAPLAIGLGAILSVAITVALAWRNPRMRAMD